MTSSRECNSFTFVWRHSAVEIGFSRQAYAVNETTGAVEICVTLSGNTATTIRVSLDTVDETATGNVICDSPCVISSVYYWLLLFVVDDDYLPPTEDLVFLGNGPQEMCTTLDILNDDHLEETETFRVFIQTNVSRGVTLNPESTQVFIMGPEGSHCVNKLSSCC